MILKDYLQAIRECPEDSVKLESGREVHRLTAKLGIYDNYPIALATDLRTFTRDLQESGRYKLIQEGARTSRERLLFDFVPGSAILQVFSCHASLRAILASSLPMEEGEIKRFKEQDRVYTTEIWIHNNEDKTIPCVDWIRGLATGVDDIGQLILRRKIPSIFPRSRGWSHLKDFSRIVCFPDKEAPR